MINMFKSPQAAFSDLSIVCDNVLAVCNAPMNVCRGSEFTIEFLVVMEPPTTCET